jgi:hypothetical protein
MKNRALLRMTVFYGPVCAAGILLLDLLTEPAIVTPSHAALVFVGASLAFFLLYKFTFALAWNRRARRLRASASASASSP